MEFKRDLIKTYENARESFRLRLDEGNKIYCGVLSLIITLSSSSLLISIALVEKIFPATASNNNLPTCLIMSWILLTISIICGIIAELKEAIFHGNQAKKAENIMRELKPKIAAGITTDTYVEDDNESYIISNQILWGALSINAY